MLVLRHIIVFAALFAATNSISDYMVSSFNKNTSSVDLTLDYTGSDDYYLKPTSPIVKRLRFVITTLSFGDFVIKITDPNKKRFEIPQGGAFPADPLASATFSMQLAGIIFTYTNQPFDFKVLRKGSNSIIFSTYDSKFIFSDYYIEIGSQLDSQYVYGLGERFQKSFRKTSGKWTIFNRDRGCNIDEGTGAQTYGHYPMYFIREKSKTFHINYFRTSNALDAVISQVTGRHFISFKAIGGIVDLRFFIGEQAPQIVLERLNLYMGRSIIPPFWAFGAHQCRWGYKNIDDLKNVISNYEKNGIPLDTIWNDIDYMVDYNDFTIDTARFPLDKMKEITDNYHYIPIIDAGIAKDSSAYNEGIKRGVFIKNADGSVLLGKVWPGVTSFVDFFQPSATKYWSDMLDVLYQQVRFSGIWLDMNELANFCDGPCGSESTNLGNALTFDYSNDLPYQPGSDGIQSHTISLNATHYNDLKEADVHAYAGMLQSQATHDFLKNKGLRPFIITRSSTFGSHKYAFHWTGDNVADWSFLKSSIADNFNFQFYGIQMVGPDICGFAANTNPQLCARWYQLATLYPFHRNHNAIDAADQEPYSLGQTVLDAAKNSLKLRYSLLKHYYTLFVEKRGLGSIFQPLFMVFPSDQNNFFDQICDTQFLVGRDLMAAPILQKGQTSRKVYFTTDVWYDFYTGDRYSLGTQAISNVQLSDKLPLFLREGYGVLVQDTTTVTKTSQLNNRYKITAAFRFDTRRSNGTFKVYESTSNILSIKDYTDDSKIDLCLRQGCVYVINMVLQDSINVRTLEFDVSYGGGLRLNELIFIDGVKVYYGGAVVVSTFVNPIQIVGPMKITIPLNDDQVSMNSISKSIQYPEKPNLDLRKETIGVNLEEILSPTTF